MLPTQRVKLVYCICFPFNLFCVCFEYIVEFHSETFLIHKIFSDNTIFMVFWIFQNIYNAVYSIVSVTIFDLLCPFSCKIEWGKLLKTLGNSVCLKNGHRKKKRLKNWGHRGIKGVWKVVEEDKIRFQKWSRKYSWSLPWPNLTPQFYFCYLFLGPPFLSVTKFRPLFTFLTQFVGPLFSFRDYFETFRVHF